MAVPVIKSRELYCIPLQNRHRPLCVGAKDKRENKWVYYTEMQLQEFADARSKETLQNMVNEPSFFETMDLPDEVMELDRKSDLYSRLCASYPEIAEGGARVDRSTSESLKLRIYGRKKIAVTGIKKFLEDFRPDPEGLHIESAKKACWFSCFGAKEKYVYAFVTEVETCTRITLSMESHTLMDLRATAGAGAGVAGGLPVGGNLNVEAAAGSGSSSVLFYAANPNSNANAAPLTFRFKAMKIVFLDTGKIKKFEAILHDDATASDDAQPIDEQRQQEEKFLEDFGDDSDIEFDDNKW